MTPEHISELLTHRDGERLDPRRSSEIEADPEMRSQLATLRQLKHDLNELPDVTPPPDTWAQIQARTMRDELGATDPMCQMGRMGPLSHGNFIT